MMVVCSESQKTYRQVLGPLSYNGATNLEVVVSIPGSRLREMVEFYIKLPNKLTLTTNVGACTH